MGRVQLNVWVEEADRAAIKAKAAELGVSIGDYVRMAVLGTKREVPSDPRAKEALDRVAGVESSQESFERRLSRLEEMAGL